MRQQQIGHRGRLEPMMGEALDQDLAHPEAAGIDERDPAMPAHQHDRAPAEPAVADGLARIALDEDLDLIAVDLHAGPARAKEGPPIGLASAHGQGYAVRRMG